MIELTHKFTPNSQLARDLIAQGANKIRKEMIGIENEVIAAVNDIIRAEFDNSRPVDRRKPGPHLLGSIKAEVSGVPGEFPVVIGVRASNVNQAKVASLESGARPHFIFPSNSKFLYFPSVRVGRGKAGGVGRGRGQGITGPGLLARGGIGSRGGKSEQLAKVPNVHHPGNRAHHFLRRGLDQVVRRRLGR